MYVVIKHEIQDADAFQTRGQEMSQQLPDGVRPLQFFPEETFRQAVCLWAGPTVDAVRDHVDGTLGDAARNEYFAVFEAAAQGLPATQQS